MNKNVSTVKECDWCKKPLLIQKFISSNEKSIICKTCADKEDFLILGQKPKKFKYLGLKICKF
jgi:hypothetical protein